MEHGSRRDVPPSRWLMSKEGALAAEGVPLAELAARFGTPLHVVSATAIEEAFHEVDRALAGLPHLVCYAMKANGNPAILRLLAALGAGIDAVSGGEVFWALEAGVSPDRIVMSGVGKTDDELRLALRAGIRSIHVESFSELGVVASLARELGVVAKVGLRINPDVDPKTHPYIATGLHGTKFGLEMDEGAEALAFIAGEPSLALEAVTSHIGSQLGDHGALREATAITARFARRALVEGHRLSLLDVGGGWPITYGDEDTPFGPHALLGDAIRAGLDEVGMRRADGSIEGGLTLVVEPGRALVGDAAVLLTRVVHEKRSRGKRFTIVDAAMTELVRPALYGAYHAIAPVAPRAGDPSATDVVGPVCESGDFFAEGRVLPPLERGDLVVLRGTGAYGASMASEYNARPRAAEVLVRGDHVELIRPRGRYEDLHPA